MERWSDNDNMDYLETRLVRRTFDRTAGLKDVSKRRFDRIDGYSSLGGLQKRVFDRIGGASSLGGLSKKSALEGTGHMPSSDQLEQRSQRAFDRIGGMSSFSGLSKKTAD